MKNIKEKLFQFINTLSKYEVYFFYTIVLINLLPLLVTKYFPTVDGPAHLYNSQLIVDLLSNNKSPISDYIEFNSNLNPNWSDHFILSGLLYILPAYLAEKILLISYLVFLPISFRFLFNTLKIKEKYLLYFIFPFTYSFMFYYGFYNFHIGLVFFFFTLGFWLKFLKSGFNYQRVFLLAVLTLCVFFSHLFVLAMMLLVIAFFNMSNLISIFKRNTENKNLIIKSISVQIAVISPVAVLVILYFISNPFTGGETEYLPASNLWEMIIQSQPAKGISYGKEAIFTKWIFILISLITIYLVFKRIKSLRSPIKNSTLNWGLICFTTVILLFTLPNGTSTFGFVSSRLILFLFLFFIVFLATQKVPLWIKIVPFVLINYVNLALTKIYTESSRKMNDISINIIAAAENIAPYSTVSSINDSENWIYGHLSNYLGVDKPMIILENYEASQNYFPLKWKSDTAAKLLIKNTKADYIFVLTDTSVNSIGVNESRTKPLLENDYELIYLSNDKSVKLFKNDKQTKY